MSPKNPWRCGNHIPVHIAQNGLQKKAFEIAFHCEKWKKMEDPGLLLPNKWKCGNHNPAHIARNDAERDKEKFKDCKNWRVVFIE